jgi:hypothetical protein
MEVLTLRDFRGGWITAEDSSDLQGWKEYENLETVRLASGSTAIRVRNPVNHYDIDNLFSCLDPLPYAPGGGAYTHPLLDLPVAADHEPWMIYQWTSGMFSKQINTILVYRSIVKAATNYQDEYTWRIYSNAPYLSYVNSLRVFNAAVPVVPDPWTFFEQFTAPMCRPEPAGGDIRIWLGPRYDARILTHIGGSTESRSYFNGTGSQVIVIGGQAQRTAALGSGGIIRNSWLYDYRKLYQHWTTATTGWAVTCTPKRDATKGIKLIDDANLRVTFIIAPVYDRMYKQIGVPFVLQMAKAQIVAAASGTGLDNVYFDLAFTGNSASWNYRLEGFHVYALVESDGLVNGSSLDFTYVGTMSVDTDMVHVTATGVVSYTFEASSQNWLQSQRTWATDSALSETLGRDLPRMNSSTGTTYKVIHPSSAQILLAETAIDVKASGSVMRKKTNYAWGVQDDPGGTRIRQSGVSGAMSHPDVFDIALTVWKPSSTWPIVRLMPFDDRMLGIHATGMQFLDLPEYPIQQGTYLAAGDTETSGLPVEFYQTMAVGSRGIFWANYEGVWVFRNDRPTNLLRGRIWDEWINIPDATKQQCTGGYNFHDDEYWLAVYPSKGSGVWRFWVWYDGEIEEGHWRKVYVTGDIRTVPRMFLSDDRKRFSVFGRSVFSPSAPLLTQFNSAEGGTDYGTQAIAYAIKSQQRGIRSGAMVVSGYMIDRDCDSGHSQTVTLYANGLSGASVTSVLAGSTKEHIGVKPLRCNTMQIKVAGSYTGGTRPLLKEISVYYQPEQRRRR